MQYLNKELEPKEITQIPYASIVERLNVYSDLLQTRLECWTDIKGI